VAPKSWSEELPADAREVLDAGRGVEPPDSVQHAVWGELAAKLPAAAATAATGGGLTSLALLKSFGLGLALGAAAVTGVTVIRHATHAAPAAPPRPEATPPRPALPSAAPPAETGAPNSVTTARGPSAAPLRGAAPASVAEPVTTAVAPPPGPSIAAFATEPPATGSTPRESPLLLESRRVAQARSLLQNGDAASALAELDGIERAFPRGSLAQEREALRIEGLLATGARARAREAARRFLAEHPKSPHAAAAERALR
jgi:hypothetical protein